MTDIAQRGNRLTRTGYAKGGRAGHLAGGVIKKVIQAGKKGVKKISDAARKKDTADRIKVFEHAGPHEGAVITKRILGKGTKKGDRTKAAVKDAMEAKPWAGKPHAKGGRIGRAAGGWTKVLPKVLPKGPKGGHPGFTKENMYERRGGGEKGKPHSSKEGRIAAGARSMQRSRKAASDAIKKWTKRPPRKANPMTLSFEHFGGGEKGKPHSSKEGRIAGGKQNIKRLMSKRKTWERPKLDKKRERKLQPYKKS